VRELSQTLQRGAGGLMGRTSRYDETAQLYDGTTLVPLEREAGDTLAERVASLPTVTLERVLLQGVTQYAHVNPPAALRAARAELDRRQGQLDARARAFETAGELLARRRWIGPALTNYSTGRT
jgi:hypothetical protein